MRKRITEKFDYSKSAADADFEKGKEYEYVSVGLGKEDDFKDLDLTGKLALIQRGKFHSQKRLRMPSIMVQQELWSTIMWKDRTLEWQLKEMQKDPICLYFKTLWGSS